MNKEEFLESIEREGIKCRSFSLYEIKDDALILDKDGYRWVVYYIERGQQSGNKSFRTESEALEYMLSALIRSQTSRQGPRGY